MNRNPIHVCLHLLSLSFHVYPCFLKPSSYFPSSSFSVCGLDLLHFFCLRFNGGMRSSELGCMHIFESPLVLVRRAYVFLFVEIKSWLVIPWERLTEAWSCNKKVDSSYESHETKFHPYIFIPKKSFFKKINENKFFIIHFRHVAFDRDHDWFY